MSVDITRPHIGRIYDYVLGGTYNHEVDRRAAQAMIALMPAYPRWARTNRGYLRHVGELWASQGRTRVLDIGSGLPTQGHFNTCLPDAKILFSDSDPLTVAQGRQILAYTSDMAYAEADLRDPDALLAQAEDFFEGERSLAVGCIGVVYFLSDEQLHDLMTRLHAFCAPGSVLAVSFPAVNDGPLTDDLREVMRAAVEVARTPFYHRTEAELAELIKPWTLSATRLAIPTEASAPIADHPMNRIGMNCVLAERG